MTCGHADVFKWTNARNNQDGPTKIFKNQSNLGTLHCSLVTAGKKAEPPQTQKPANEVVRRTCSLVNLGNLILFLKGLELHPGKVLRGQTDALVSNDQTKLNHEKPFQHKYLPLPTPYHSLSAFETCGERHCPSNVNGWQMLSNSRTTRAKCD